MIIGKESFHQVQIVCAHAPDCGIQSCASFSSFFVTNGQCEVLSQLALFLVSSEIKFSPVESLLQDGLQVQGPDIAMLAKGLDEGDFKFSEIIKALNRGEPLNFGDGFST